MKITTARVAYIPKHFNCNQVDPIYNPYSSEEKARVTSRERVTYNMTMENQLSCDVWVCFRNGTYTKMQRSVGIRTAKRFIVTVDQSFTRPLNNEPHIDMLDSFGVLSDNATTATQAVHSGLEYRVSVAQGGAIGNLVRYQLTEEEIGSEPNGMYIEELDIVVSLTSCFPNTLHPYSDAAKRYTSTLESNTPKSPPKIAGLNFFIKIIDNESKFAIRFIKIGNHTFAVPSFKDSSLKDGVYVGGAEPINGSSNVQRRSKFYTIGAADVELPLFKTVEEADAAPESIIKVREVELQNDTIDLKRKQIDYGLDELREKAEESKRKLEFESMRAKVEKDKMQDDLVRREHETRLRAEHEAKQRRASYRNEILEVSKMLVTIAGCYVAYIKLKK